MGIGTFYHQFPDKAELMRYLMDQEHDFRVQAFDALAANGSDGVAAEVVRVIGGSDPALLRAMIEACGVDARLRDFARDLRRKTQERLAAAIAHARQARDCRQPILDASTAAWAILVLGDADIDGAATAEIGKIIDSLAFAESDGKRVRA